MIRLYTKIEQQLVKNCALLIQKSFAYVNTILKPGLYQTELVQKIRRFVEHRGGTLHVIRGFPQPLCLCVNEVVAHGVAQEIQFKPGDLVTVDISVKMNGWIADAAWTFGIPPLEYFDEVLLRNAWLITANAIKSIEIGKPLNTVGASIEENVDFCGMEVFKEFSGHGVGKELHEAPSVLHYKNDLLSNRVLIKPGMVFTVEPIVKFGKSEMQRLPNGFTYVSKDNRKTAQFEHTVAIQEDGAHVLSYFGCNASNLPHLLQYSDPFASLSERT